MHGGWLLVFVSLLAFVLRMIPTSALAAMLVYTGYKLVNFKAIRELKRYGWGEVVVYFATLTTIVCVDLLTGVVTGIVLSAVKLLYTFSICMCALISISLRERPCCDCTVPPRSFACPTCF